MILRLLLLLSKIDKKLLFTGNFQDDFALTPLESNSIRNGNFSNNT